MSKKNKRNRIVIDFSGSEILERDVSKFGTGAHVIVPKEHLGKNVKIIVGEEEEEDE